METSYSVQALVLIREIVPLEVEGGNIGTWDWDLDTGDLTFNRKWAEVLGYSRDELDVHFNTWEALVHPDDLKRATNMLDRYIDGEIDTYNPEIRMRTGAGEWKWIQTIGQVIERDEDDNVTRVAGIHLDISERQAREKGSVRFRRRWSRPTKRFSSPRPLLSTSRDRASSTSTRRLRT